MDAVSPHEFEDPMLDSLLGDGESPPSNLPSLHDHAFDNGFTQGRDKKVTELHSQHTQQVVEECISKLDLYDSFATECLSMASKFQK